MVFTDISRPASRHDVLQLRECGLDAILRTFPINANNDPVYKIIADDGFRGVGYGIDAHMVLRKGFPQQCHTPLDQARFSRAVEFIRATVEHVNGDFKILFHGLVNPSPRRPLAVYLAENEVAVLAYSFFRRVNPIAASRYDRFGNL